MNTPDTNKQSQNTKALIKDLEILDFIESIPEHRKINLMAFALEILGCLANGTDKILDYELEEEMEQSGLEAFYEENERRLRGLRRTSPN